MSAAADCCPMSLGVSLILPLVAGYRRARGRGERAAEGIGARIRQCECSLSFMTDLAGNFGANAIGRGQVAAYREATTGSGLLHVSAGRLPCCRRSHDVAGCAATDVAPRDVERTCLTHPYASLFCRDSPEDSEEWMSSLLRVSILEGTPRVLLLLRRQGPLMFHPGRLAAGRDPPALAIFATPASVARWWSCSGPGSLRLSRRSGQRR